MISYRIDWQHKTTNGAWIHFNFAGYATIEAARAELVAIQASDLDLGSTGLSYRIVRVTTEVVQLDAIIA